MNFDPAVYVEALRAKSRGGAKTDELLITANFRALAEHVLTRYRETRAFDPDTISHLRMFGILVEPFDPEPVTLFERTSEDVKALTREATPREAEIVSVWDPRTWIAPEKAVNAKPVTIFYENNDPTPPKTYKRIDKIAKF